MANQNIDPKLYGLPPRTILIKSGPEEFILVINRKTRIIMKDAKAILNKVDKIKERIPDASVSFETTAPICSKSIKFLEKNGVEIIKSSI